MKNLILILLLLPLSLLGQQEGNFGLIGSLNGATNTKTLNTSASLGVMYDVNGLRMSVRYSTENSVSFLAEGFLPLGSKDKYDFGIVGGFGYGKSFDKRSKVFFDCQTENQYLFADDFVFWKGAPSFRYHVNDQITLEAQSGARYLAAVDEKEWQYFSQINMIFIFL